MVKCQDGEPRDLGEMPGRNVTEMVAKAKENRSELESERRFILKEYPEYGRVLEEFPGDCFYEFKNLNMDQLTWVRESLEIFQRRNKVLDILNEGVGVFIHPGLKKILTWGNLYGQDIRGYLDMNSAFDAIEARSEEKKKKGLCHVLEEVPKVRRCNKPGHEGMTVQCPRARPGTSCVTCIACEIENPNSEEVCGSLIWDDQGKNRSITGRECNNLPKISMEALDYLRRSERDWRVHNGDVCRNRDALQEEYVKYKNLLEEAEEKIRRLEYHTIEEGKDIKDPEPGMWIAIDKKDRRMSLAFVSMWRYGGVVKKEVATIGDDGTPDLDEFEFYIKIPMPIVKGKHYKLNEDSFSYDPWDPNTDIKEAVAQGLVVVCGDSLPQGVIDHPKEPKLVQVSGHSIGDDNLVAGSDYTSSPVTPDIPCPNCGKMVYSNVEHFGVIDGRNGYSCGGLNKIEEDMGKWIDEHGSNYLREIRGAKYTYFRQYREERLKVEYPNIKSYYWDLDDSARYKDRDSPSINALECARLLRGRVVWMTNIPKSALASVDDRDLSNMTDMQKSWEVSKRNEEQEAVLIELPWSKHKLFICDRSRFD